MEERIDQSVLEQLCAEIERAWIDRRDPTTVDTLAAKHPDYSEELYEFFSILVLGETTEPDERTRKAVEKVGGWLKEEGFNHAAEVARRERRRNRTFPGTEPTTPQDNPGRISVKGSGDPPQTFIAFLRDRTGQPLDIVAQAIDNVTHEFLINLGRFPLVVPEVVRRELSERIQEAWGIPQEEVLRTLQTPPPQMSRAASRSGPPGRNPDTFEEVLKRSGFTVAQRRYWMRISQGGET